jgi:hypothetical protein
MATPRWVKQLGSSAAVQATLGTLIGLYLRLCFATARVTLKGAPPPGPALVTMWHGRLLFLPLVYRGFATPLSALISGHRDGRLISRTGEHFGFETVTGSTTRGGLAAARELVRRAKAGHSLFVTPDGPRGPRMTVVSGALDIARLTGLPVYTVSGGSARRLTLNSWDRLVLPVPFSRVTLSWKALPADATPEHFAAALTICQDDA